jgi:hypothetical protein
MNVVKGVWIPLTIVDRLHGVFGVHGYAASAAGVDDVKPFNPKQVRLEVFGPAGATADINYLDVNAVPQRIDDTPLPWSYSVSTVAPAVSVNVVAQADSQVIGCRITVNGDIKDQRTVVGVHPQTFCLVKSA